MAVSTICAQCGGDPRYTGRRRGCLCVTVGPDHPLWKAWNDDDWNGATAANWLNSFAVPRARITLAIPMGVSPDLVRRMRERIEASGATVVVDDGEE